MPTEAENELTEEKWLDLLAKDHPEAGLPGFWVNIADNCTRWAEQMHLLPFWKRVHQELPKWRTEYRQKTGEALFSTDDLPMFFAKSEARIRNKLFQQYREEIEEKRNNRIRQAFNMQGTPISSLKDMVRTRVNCRYLDGVEFFATKISELGEEMGCLYDNRQREGRIEGYFAQHVTISQDVLFILAGQARATKVICEIQVATDMATRMWNATHPLYEKVRNEKSAPQNWQWDPNDPQFIANQLGHMIHLADGLLIQLRDKILKGKGQT